MPRRPRSDGLSTSETRNVNFRLPVDLHNQIKLLLLDPKTGRVPPWGWSGVVEQALRVWLTKNQVVQPNVR